LGVGDAFDKTCLVDFQQTWEIFRLIRADFQHAIIVLAFI